MKTYRFKICKTGGTTLLEVEFDGEDMYQAQVKMHTAYPEYEIVLWGLASEIDA